jgi:hypothetical protein
MAAGESISKALLFAAHDTTPIAVKALLEVISKLNLIEKNSAFTEKDILRKMIWCQPAIVPTILEIMSTLSRDQQVEILKEKSTFGLNPLMYALRLVPAVVEPILAMIAKLPVKEQADIFKDSEIISITMDYRPAFLSRIIDTISSWAVAEQKAFFTDVLSNQYTAVRLLRGMAHLPASYVQMFTQFNKNILVNYLLERVNFPDLGEGAYLALLESAVAKNAISLPDNALSALLHHTTRTQQFFNCCCGDSNSFNLIRVGEEIKKLKAHTIQVEATAINLL